MKEAIVIALVYLSGYVCAYQAIKSAIKKINIELWNSKTMRFVLLFSLLSWWYVFAGMIFILFTILYLIGKSGAARVKSPYEFFCQFLINDWQPVWTYTLVSSVYHYESMTFQDKARVYEIFYSESRRKYKLKLSGYKPKEHEVYSTAVLKLNELITKNK